MAKSDRELLEASDLFDPEFYLFQYPDVAETGADALDHYLFWGSAEGRRPSAYFDGKWYLEQNPDVSATGINPLVHYLRFGRSEGRRAFKDCVVYTAVVGDFDDVFPPIVQDPNVDYFAFVDSAASVPQPWISLPITKRFRTDRLTSRFYKMHPHLIFPQYQLSAWVDASLRIRSIAAETLIAALADAPIAFFAHPDRNCAYDEAAVVKERGLIDPSVVDKTVHLLESSSFPRSVGLVAGGVIIRKHDSSSVSAAMEEWWHLVQSLGERDQLTLNFALWKHAVHHAIIPGNLWANDLVVWSGHKGVAHQSKGEEIVFDKYERLGDYHWREFAAGTVYAEHARFCMQWVREKPCLDIGCGDGLITFLLGAEGVDPSDTAIRYAQSHHSKASLGSAYGLPDKNYQAVFMGDVIEHLERPIEAIIQARNVLQKAGRLYIVTPPKQEVLSDYHYREYTPDELKETVEAQGFVLEEVIIRPEWVRMYAKFRLKDN